MIAKLEGEDINKIYRSVAVKCGLQLSTVKECVESYLSQCAEEIRELEEGESRIRRVGVFKVRTGKKR